MQYLKQIRQCLNSFTATGDNNRLLQTAQIQMRGLIEPSHLDLRSGLLVAHFENIGFYIGSSYSKYRLFTGFSIKIQVKKRVFQTYIKI